MGARVIIGTGPDGESLIRVRPSAARRAARGVEFAAAAFAAFALKYALDPDAGLSSYPWLPVITLTLVALLAALFWPSETVRVWDGLVTIRQTFGKRELSRAEQPTPQYCPLPSRVWGAQRYGSEKGSGVLMLGEGANGVRFGDNLDEADALRVIEVFRSRDGSN